MNNFELKLIALITMIIDHIGYVFFPQYFFMRFIGRLAFPIYAFLISEGIKHTKDIKLYLKNLFILSIISEPFYDLCFNSNINFLKNTNTVYTLFLATLSIYIFNNCKNNIEKLLTILSFLLLTNILMTDYNVFGLILVYIFYFSTNMYKKLLYSFLLITFKFKYIFIYFIHFFVMKNMFVSTKYIFSSFGLYIFTLLGLFILSLYNNTLGKKMKYLFYIMYPLHLAIIYFIKMTY